MQLRKITFELSFCHSFCLNMLGYTYLIISVMHFNFNFATYKSFQNSSKLLYEMANVNYVISFSFCTKPF